MHQMYGLAEKTKTAKTEVQRKAIENEYGACLWLSEFQNKF